MIVGVPRETCPGERRVALVPTAVPPLTKAGLEILVETGAGVAAGFTDAAYESHGAKIAPTRADLFARADILFQVRTLGANPQAGAADLAALRKGQLVIGMGEPLSPSDAAARQAERGVTLFALELLPRITRGQSMDTLSSMATIAGYKAVVLAAAELPRLMPMMTTAAGTITPAKAFVIGAGVAGLQAIASSRRMGAQVRAYDVRPAVKEQIESLGAKFVELPLETAGAEDKGGYAKAQDEEFYRKQRELMGRVIGESDLVIATAAVPGKKAPVLITAEMVKGMQPGSVIMDLAAERGGNCELTKPGERVEQHGVVILGPLNLPSSVPFHASQMYAKNISNFLLNMVKKGELVLNLEDEIVRDTMVTRDGEVVSARVREVNGMAARPAAGAAAPPQPAAAPA